METSTIKLDLETRISSFIEKSNINHCSIEFVYAPGSNQGLDLYVITHNPIHKNSFLFLKTWGITEEIALENALFELNHPNKGNENSYTVTWEKIGNSTQNSYFSGYSIYEVLDKFYHNKNPKEYIIFGVQLNPIS